jgi:tRNA nucleotidyltransferase (CCA-adding enzyme)
VEQRPPDPLLLGRHLLDLGIEPGPRMGEITRAVYEMQLDGRVRNLDEAIAEARKIVNRG